MRTRISSLAVLSLLGLVLGGCELVADFDRDKIPGPDAGLGMDASNAPADGATDDEDGGAELDAALDSGAAAMDAATDGGADASTDAGQDAGADSGSDAASGDDAGSEDDAG